jgi:hypothetical protein
VAGSVRCLRRSLSVQRCFGRCLPSPTNVLTYFEVCAYACPILTMNNCPLAAVLGQRCCWSLAGRSYRECFWKKSAMKKLMTTVATGWGLQNCCSEPKQNCTPELKLHNWIDETLWGSFDPCLGRVSIKKSGGYGVYTVRLALTRVLYRICYTALSRLRTLGLATTGRYSCSTILKPQRPLRIEPRIY